MLLRTGMALSVERNWLNGIEHAKAGCTRNTSPIPPYLPLFSVSTIKTGIPTVLCCPAHAYVGLNSHIGLVGGFVRIALAPLAFSAPKVSISCESWSAEGKKRGLLPTDS